MKVTFALAGPLAETASHHQRSTAQRVIAPNLSKRILIRLLEEFEQSCSSREPVVKSRAGRAR